MGHGPGLPFQGNEFIQGRSIRSWVRFWVGAGAEDPLGWVVVQLLFGRIAAGTVTNDGPGSGRKEFNALLGVETLTKGGTWRICSAECLEEY